MSEPHYRLVEMCVMYRLFRGVMRQVVAYEKSVRTKLRDRKQVRGRKWQTGCFARMPPGFRDMQCQPDPKLKGKESV